MKEYIERVTALNALIRALGYCQCANDVITRIPAADVAEVRHGRWIFDPGKIPYCSECKEYSDDGDKGATFCPWCGARMGKEDEHEVSEL